MFESLIENIIPSDSKPLTKLKKVIHHFSDSSSEDENIKPRPSKDFKMSSSSLSLSSSSLSSSISKSTNNNKKAKQSIVIPRKSTLTAKDEMRKSVIYNTVSDIEELKSQRLARFRIPMVNNLIDSFISSSDDEEPNTSGRNRRKESKDSSSEGEPIETETETKNKQKKKNQYLRSFDDDSSSDES